MRVALVAVAALAALAGATARAAGAPTLPRVLLVGDSITAGVVSGPHPLEESGANGPGFAALVGEALARRAEVASLGLGRSTAQEWVAHLREHGPARAPGEIVVVLLGTNDALALPERPPATRAEFGARIRELARGYATAFRRVVLMTPPPAPARHPNASEAWTQRLAGYREELRAACAGEARVVCGPDLFALLDPEADYHAGDLHPNARGHRRIAEALVAVLGPLLSGGVEADRQPLRPAEGRADDARRRLGGVEAQAGQARE